jgi:hypothetical protein
MLYEFDPWLSWSSSSLSSESSPPLLTGFFYFERRLDDLPGSVVFLYQYFRIIFLLLLRVRSSTAALSSKEYLAGKGLGLSKQLLEALL